MTIDVKSVIIGMLAGAALVQYRAAIAVAKDLLKEKNQREEA